MFSTSPKLHCVRPLTHRGVVSPLRSLNEISMIVNELPRQQSLRGGGVKTVNNIAVQTESVDTLVNRQLKDVDASIERRLKTFEKDLRLMREQLAKALREKEELMRRLHKLQQQLNYKDLELKTMSMPCFNLDLPDKVCNTCGESTQLHDIAGRCRPSREDDSTC